MQIHQDLQAAIFAKTLQAPDANRMYMVYVEPGVVITQGGSTSATVFLGYHGAFAGKTANNNPVDIRYGMIAYPGNGFPYNPTYFGQGFFSPVDQLEVVSSHELGECVTDPDVNYKVLGWYDDLNNGETFDFSTSHREFFGPYRVQGFIGQNDNQLVAPTSLAAPVISSVSVLTSTVARVNWSTVPEAEGYQIFSLTGGKHAVSPVLPASATTGVASGLVPGVNLLVVEAISTGINFPVPAGNVDSNPSPIIMPVPLPTPTVSAVINSSTTATLNWTSSAGAAGYRIYEKIGTQIFLVGIVAPNTLSYNLAGLTHGQTVQFMVEAFSGIQFSDSAWTDVTT
jgi:hypothetical protein